jgi:hypothetical protein
MKKDMQEHLEQNRILTAFIDKTDLSPSEREHLEHCDACGRAVQVLAGQLRRVSDEALRHTPGTRVKVELPELEAKSWFGLYGKWIAAPALAAACIALLVIFLQPGIFSAPRPYGNVSLAEEATADALLMAEIDDIQQGGLSSPIDDASAVPASDIDDDEDFLDDLIPIDTGAQS